MLQIVPFEGHSDPPGLTVHGRITGDDVTLLAREVEPCLEAGNSLVLDLDGVRAIDRESTERLRGWVDQGLALRGGSMFVRLLLRKRGLGDER